MKRLISLSRNLSFQVEDETHRPIATAELILALGETTYAIDSKGEFTRGMDSVECVRIFITRQGLIELAAYCTDLADEMKQLPRRVAESAQVKVDEMKKRVDDVNPSGRPIQHPVRQGVVGVNEIRFVHAFIFA